MSLTCRFEYFNICLQDNDFRYSGGVEKERAFEDEDEEEEMLRRAIAMSLEEEEE